MIKGDLHLRLLSIFHYIIGGLILFFVSMPLIIFAMGSVGIISSESALKIIIISTGSIIERGGAQLPQFLGSVVLAIGVFIYLTVITIAICMVVSGIFLAKRKLYLFSLIVACIECIFIPFGTLLGIFTVIVLSSDSVRALYGRASEKVA